MNNFTTKQYNRHGTLHIKKHYITQTGNLVIFANNCSLILILKLLPFLHFIKMGRLLYKFEP